MAMSVGGGGAEGDPDVMVEMNTTPLIDVMLVLLVMLIITLPVQTHEVKMDNPKGGPPPATLPPVIGVVVDFDGTIEWTPANGGAPITITSRPQLEQLLSDAAIESDNPELHLQPNKLAPYKVVAEVLAEAQRLGVVRIGIVGNEQLVQ
jgi:biopolymer transport protein ExbD